jgi:hypothetical protein
MSFDHLSNLDFAQLDNVVRTAPSEFLSAIVNAMGRYLARILCIKTNILIKRGSRGVLSPAKKLFEKEPLIDVMFRSGNPLYAMTNVIISRLNRSLQFGQAIDQHILLCNALYSEMDVLMRDSRADGIRRNGFIGEEILEFEVFTSGYTYKDTRFEYTAGFLQQAFVCHIETLLQRWLSDVDVAVTRCFEIETQASDHVAVARIIQRFSRMISQHLCYVTPDSEDSDYTPTLGETEFLQISRCQFVRCEAAARRQFDKDLEALLQLQILTATPFDRSRAAEVLQRPAKVAQLLSRMPPEWYSTGNYHADVEQALECLLDVTSDTRLLPSQRITLMDLYHNESTCSLPTVMIVHARVKDTIGLLRQWTPKSDYFLPVVKHLVGATRENCKCMETLLPITTWVEQKRVWVIRKTRFLRHGLDSEGFRIVALSSILWQLGAMVDPLEFQPGVFSPRVVQRIVATELVKSTQTKTVLSEETLPLLTGFDNQFSETQISKCRGSHIENEVLSASVELSNFSMAEIVACFHQKSLMFSCIDFNLSTQTRESLVRRPPPHYRSFTMPLLRILLPILAHDRENCGVCFVSKTSATADLLRCIPSLKAWHQRQLQLFMTTGKVDNDAHVLVAEEETRLLPQSIQESLRSLVFTTANPMATLRMRGPRGAARKATWVFNAPQLVQMLAS